MQDYHLFEYAVIRVVPRVEREEFINAGVILYCARKKFLQVIIAADESRLAAFAAQSDINEIKQNLKALERICTGQKDGGPIGQLDLASRFRWLTATRSTVIQTSKVHPGFCKDPLEKLTQLVAKQVL